MKGKMFRGKTTCFIRMFMRHFMNVHVGLYIRPREVTHIYVGIINFLFMYKNTSSYAKKIRMFINKHKFILKKEQDLFKKLTYVIYQLLQAK